ncbi:MAG: protein translocase subunit SecF [Candidatus Colwellbacteria bacterium]|nr:protein translocase subunit SecF [Candidatus Colwellbacteria bacterium]
MKANIIKHSNWFLFFSVLFVALSVTSIIVFGLKPGIDFRSGSAWQVRIPGADERTIKNFFEADLGFSDPIISYDKENDSYSVIFKEISGEEHKAALDKVKEKFTGAEELDFGTTSPSVSSELKQKAIWIIALSLAVMAIYVAIAFRKVSYPVKSYKYGLITIIALAHDCVIAAGFFALLGFLRGATIDTNFIVALLTIAGFSSQDTIVIFDRVRENLLNAKGKGDLPEIVNRSLNEVFRRSLNTSVSVMLVLAAIALFGPLSVRYFAMTMVIGLFFGTYSSLFVASPLLVLWHKIDMARKGGKAVK